LNEKRIQQVLEIEKQANAIREAMIDEAAQLPSQAEKEAKALIEKSRAEAEREAREIIAKAQAEEETADILAQVKEKIHHTETLAQGHLNNAVTYVVAHVVGKG
jgi:vacuolar-type H+-ATPase subunit H